MGVAGKNQTMEHEGKEVRMKDGLMRLIVLLCFAATITSCTASPDYDRVYDQLTTGITPTEAEKIMGPPRKRESITVAGATMEKFTWCHRNEFYSATFALGHLVFTERGKNQ